MNIIIVIPCFNEFNRLPIFEFSNYKSEHCNVRFHFVNDGSTDQTIQLLDKLNKQFPNKFTYLDLINNQGKAEAIRQGIKSLTHENFDFIAYLDADLSTPLYEINNVINYLKYNPEKKIVFGSRVKLMHNIVERNIIRHFVGRIFSTVASMLLKLKIYDTQCGFKVFSKDLCPIIFNDKFISKWLFDIEIFIRIIIKFSIKETIKFSYEMPVNTWIEKGNSKIKISYYFKAPYDLFRIYKFYYNDFSKNN